MEDLGRAGDITSQATIPATERASAVIAARKVGVLCGIGFAETAFRLVEPGLKISMLKKNGNNLLEDDVIARISGPARRLFSAERVALNYLCHL